MSTVDTLVSLGQRIEANAARQREPIEWRKLLVAVLTGIPYLVGMFVGKAVYAARLTWAAMAEGYRVGDAPAARTPETSRTPRMATSTLDG